MKSSIKGLFVILAIVMSFVARTKCLRRNGDRND